MSLKQAYSFSAVQDFDEITLPETRTIRLNNGINLNIAPPDTSGICRFQLILQGGTLDYDNQMIPRLTALSLFEGTKQRKREEIAASLDYCGVNIERKVSLHHIILDFTVLKRLVPKIFNIVLDSICNPIFEPEFISILKTNQNQAIKQLLERPKSLATLNFNAHSYPDVSRIGYIPHSVDIDRITISDIEQCHKNMINSGITIIASGEITNDIIDYINNTLELYKLRPLSGHNFECKPVTNFSDNNTYIISRDAAVQSSIVCGVNVPARTDKDFINTRIACVLLGGFFGSRLIQRVREKDGLTYGISSQITSIDGYGRMKISTDCDIAYTQKVIEDIKEEMLKMQNIPTTDEELSMLKSYLMSQYARLIDKSMDMAEYMVSQITMNIDGLFFNNQVKQLQRITAESICEVSKAYFNPDELLSVIVTKK